MLLAHLSQLAPLVALRDVWPGPLTRLTLSSDGRISIVSEMSCNACVQIIWTLDVKVTTSGRGLSNRVYLRIRDLARSNTAPSAPVTWLRREMAPEEYIACRGVLS